MFHQEIGAIPPGNEPAAHASSTEFLCRLYISYLHMTIQIYPGRTQPPAAFL